MATIYSPSMPYDSIDIIDRSVYDDSANVAGTTVPTGPIAYVPFVSPRGYGEDNKLIYMNSARLAKYGSPNLAKYGLSLYIANRFAQGGGTTLGVRVVPAFTAAADSVPAHGKSYANACVYAVVGGTGTAKTIKYGVVSLDASANTVLADFKAADADDLGEASDTGLYKLFVIRAKSAGDFANAFSFTLSNDATMNSLAEENEYNAHFYRIAVKENDKALDQDMVFCLNDGFTYNGESMFLADVVDAYSDNIAVDMVTGANGFEAFLAALNAPADADILFATTFTNNDSTATTFTVTSTAIKETTINLSKAVPLFAPGTVFDWDDDPFATVLAGAYKPTGTHDPEFDLIYDEYRFPFEYMFAPSYDADLVAAMKDLVTKRHITFCSYIAPWAATYASQETAWTNGAYSLADENGWKAFVVPAWAVVIDPWTGKKTKMPSTYFDAYGYPDHWLNKKGKPYAGPANYYWSNFVLGSVSPFTSDPERLVANHAAKFNTMVEDGNGYAVPYEQVTCYNKTSALSEINNAITLCDMIRICLQLANTKRWSDLSDDVIASYKDEVLNAISAELSGCYDTVTVVTAREAANGAGRNRIQCNINVKFRDVLKGVSYTFYIVASDEQ